MILNVDCMEGMRKYCVANMFDSIVTDPPYELGFMGKAWDASGIANSVEMWREALRVLKPGGHLLAFSGSRTYHRMVCAIEDAGFEIRDQIMWVYGSGFPKSLDVSKAIDKAAGAERVRNLVPSKLGNAVRRGEGKQGATFGDSHGGFTDASEPVTDAARQWQGWGTALKPAHEPIVVARKPLAGTVAANVLQHGTGALNIDGCRVPHVTIEGGTLAQNSHLRTSIRRAAGDSMFGNTEESAASMEALGRWPANLIHDGSDEVLAAFPQDAGRFFYCAKASKSDRGEGNVHPTVKPTDLMRYLCRLVTPPGGTVLDLFAGSGSTGKAAHLEGFGFMGFEKDPHYAELARQRIKL